MMDRTSEMVMKMISQLRGLGLSIDPEAASLVLVNIGAITTQEWIAYNKRHYANALAAARN
jgi:hypothetical protein